MTLRDKLALYGPNTPRWERSTYDRIERSRVPRVVWRTDADPSAPYQLRRRGIDVIAQAPDRYSGNAWFDPGKTVQDVYAIVSRCCWPGTPVVLDNEPQLHPQYASQWHAEQYTRYYRAAASRWHWLDHEARYPLVSPALAPGTDRNGALWHALDGEWGNLVAGLGLHAYWEDDYSMHSPDFGMPWRLLPEPAAGGPVYLLEWGNADRHYTHEDHLAQYERWLRALPDNVACAALFLLDGTDDWPQYEISDRVLDWLANLEE